MKKFLTFLIFYGILYSTQIGGETKLNNFYYIFSGDSVKPVPYMFHQFKVEFYEHFEKYDFTGSLLFRLWTEKSALSFSGLSNPSFKVEPHLWELYLAIYGFIFDNLDLKIGKQRISWGTADKLNPTDILNPYDLQNPFDFGKKMSSEAILFDISLPREFTFEGVFIPKFVAPLLPKGEFPLFLFIENPEIKEKEDTIIYPEEKNFKNSMFAGKMYGKLFKWDFSLSYFYGYDNFPLPSNINLIPIDTLGNLKMETKLKFPKVQMIGFDFSGEFKTIGIWGELGYFNPHKFILKTTIPISSPPYFIEKDSTLLKEPYLKFTFGFDYTFKNGIYINTQWNHGFFFERGEELHDYFVARGEKKFFREKLKIGLAGIYEIADRDSIRDNYGYGIIPEVLYKPHDNVEISLGTILLDGKGKSILGLWKDFDQFYLNFKVSF